MARIVRAVEEGQRIACYGDYDVDGVTSTVLLSGLPARRRGRRDDLHPAPAGGGLRPERRGGGAAGRGGSEPHRHPRLRHHQRGRGRGGGAEGRRRRRRRPPHRPRRAPRGQRHPEPAPGPAAATRRSTSPRWGSPSTSPWRCGSGCGSAAGSGPRAPSPTSGRPSTWSRSGTVADVVPLLEVNRMLVRHGLAELGKARRPGIRALLRVAGVATGEVTAAQVGFRLAPRVNAAGRLDDAGRGVRLLSTADPAVADALAEELDRENRARQEIERLMLEEALPTPPSAWRPARAGSCSPGPAGTPAWWASSPPASWSASTARRSWWAWPAGWGRAAAAASRPSTCTTRSPPAPGTWSSSAATGTPPASPSRPSPSPPSGRPSSATPPRSSATTTWSPTPGSTAGSTRRRSTTGRRRTSRSWPPSAPGIPSRSSASAPGRRGRARSGPPASTSSSALADRDAIAFQMGDRLPLCAGTGGGRGLAGLRRLGRDAAPAAPGPRPPGRAPARRARRPRVIRVLTRRVRRCYRARFPKDFAGRHAWPVSSPSSSAPTPAASSTKADIGKEVVLFGWVNNRRDHGGAVFIDLRDRDGLTQVVFEPDVRPEVHELAEQLRLEYCVGIRGKVVSRGAQREPEARDRRDRGPRHRRWRSSTAPSRRPSRSRTRSTPPRRSGSQYRYLDLRRAPLQKTLMTRARVNHLTRNYFTDERLPRARDALHGEVHAGRRPQLPRPQPPQPGQVLRAGREPAALQAALHDGGLRPVLPDRALLPRRGPAPRPPARVHPDRRGDDLRRRRTTSSTSSRG